MKTNETRRGTADDCGTPRDSCNPGDWISTPYDPAPGGAARALADILARRQARQEVEADPVPATPRY